MWMLLYIVANTFINYRGIEVTDKVVKIVFVLGMIVYTWFVVAGIFAITEGVNSIKFTFAPVYNGANLGLAAIMAAVSIAVFNFGGPDSVTTLGEETKDGAKTIGRGVVLTFAVLGGLYFLLTYVAALSWPDYATHENTDIAFYQIAEVIGGPSLKWAFTLAMGTAVGFSCSVCAQACSSRVLYAMARDNMFPKILAKVHPEYKSPYISVIFTGIISLIICFIFTNKAENLTSILNYNILLSWLAVNFTTIFFYMIRQRSKNYFIDLVCPILGGFIVGYTFLSLTTQAWTFGPIWLGIGFIFMLYLIYVKKIDISFASDSGI
jgi:amino acid transporter